MDINVEILPVYQALKAIAESKKPHKHCLRCGKLHKQAAQARFCYPCKRANDRDRKRILAASKEIENNA